MIDYFNFNFRCNRRLVTAVHWLVESRNDLFCCKSFNKGRTVKVSHVIRWWSPKEIRKDFFLASSKVFSQPRPSSGRIVSCLIISLSSCGVGPEYALSSEKASAMTSDTSRLIFLNSSLSVLLSVRKIVFMLCPKKCRKRHINFVMLFDSETGSECQASMLVRHFRLIKRLWIICILYLLQERTFQK